MSNARNIAALSTVEVGATADQTKADLNAIGVSGGRKNLIINGGMDVWQRGTSFTNVSNGAYGADRFNTSRSNTVNITRVTSGVQGFKYAHRSTNAGAGTPTLYHYIENSGQFYEGQSVTLSYWARASEAITVRSCRVYDGSAYVTGYTTVDLDTSWKKFSVTQVINSNWAGTEAAFMVQVWAGHGITMSAGSWIETTGVQLELGSVATDFEHRSYGEELQLCQRYYQILDFTRSHLGVLHRATGTTAGLPYTVFSLTATMRAYPSMTTSGTWATAVDQAGTPTLYETSYSSVTLRGNNGDIVSGGSQWLRGGFCNFDAEL